MTDLPDTFPSALTIGDAQRRVDDWISQFVEGYFPPLVNLARLLEEAGELSRALSHESGVKKPKPGEEVGDVEEELGDLFFVLICLANQRGLSLEEAILRVLKKIEVRDAKRWTRRSDDDMAE